jgi:flagellar motor component MotA
MKRYWLSILVLAAGLAFTVFGGGGNLLPYLDLPSFIITVAAPFLFVTILFGFKETNRAFAILRKKESDHGTLLTALVFFKAYSKATWLSALIAVFIGGIGILINLDNKAAIGPNMAIALLALLYCGVVQLAIIIPHTVSIHKQLGNSRIRNDILSIFGSLFGVIFTLLLLFIIFLPD